MFKKVPLIAASAYLFFIIETMLNHYLGPWVKPELLLLLVVFWGLYAGIRYSIVAAVFCGLLKDMFSILPFGTNLFVYVASAYLTTLVRQNLYQPGSRFSRAVVAFFVLLGAFILQSAIYLTNNDIGWKEILSFVFLPQLVTTMLVVTFVFHRLRDIAIRFKI